MKTYESQPWYKPMAVIKANQREKIQYDFKNIDPLAQEKLDV